MIRHSIYSLTIICFGISSCATGPTKTYLVLSDKAELTGDYTEVRKFEARVEKAEQYFASKVACFADDECVWYCEWRGQAPSSRVSRNLYPKDIDSLVRRWRHEHNACGPMSKDNIERMMRSY